MLTALALSATIAHATEVATSKKFGIGVATGPSAISGTGKFYLDEKGGIAFYLGTSFYYHQVRVNYEREAIEFADWSFARFILYWDAGVDLGLYTSYLGYSGAAGNLGVGGGAGVELQFHSVPAQVFVDGGLGIFPLNYCSGYEVYGVGALCLVQPRGAAGGRWFF